MDGLAAGNGLVDGAAQGAVFLKPASFEVVVDTGQALVYNPAGAEIHMADFRVVYLALGQAHEHTRGIDESLRLLLPQFVPEGCSGVGNGVVISRVTVPPAIKNNQCSGFARFGHRFVRLVAKTA